MLRKVYEYIKDDEFRFTVYDKKIHVVNYKKIISLKNTFVSIKGDFTINIYGRDLVLNSLLDSEILIIGNISNVEVIYD